MEIEKIVEIEAYKNNEPCYFDSIYEEDLKGEAGNRLTRFLKGAEDCDRLVVYLYAEGGSDILNMWEKEITNKSAADILLDIFKEIMENA